MLATVTGVNVYFQPRNSGNKLCIVDAIRGKQSSSVFGKGVVRIAIQPSLADLGGRDDRMSAGPRVFAGMLVWRTVTAERHAARLACPQVNPVTANLHTFLAFAALRLLD